MKHESWKDGKRVTSHQKQTGKPGKPKPGNTKSKKSMRDYIQVVFKFNTKRLAQLAGDYNGVSLVFGKLEKGKRNQELQYST